MFSFKVKESTHNGIKKGTKIFAVIAFISAFIIFGIQNINNYLTSSEILSDHSVVDAALSFDGISEARGRKGRVREIFHFTYLFEVEGTTYSEEFTTSESNAVDYIESDFIKVAYSNAKPAMFGRLTKLESHYSVGGIFKRMGLSLLVLLFALSAFYMIITRKLILPKVEVVKVPASA